MEKLYDNKKEKKDLKALLLPSVAVIVLVVIVAATTYTYFTAAATNNAGIQGNTADIDLDLDVTRISTAASGALLPLDNDVENLNMAAKGFGNTGNTFDGDLSCIDKEGFTACQIYQIDITNDSSSTISLSGGVTALSGTNMPNLNCAVMDSSTSITSNSTCVGSTTIASNVSFNANETKTYYIMVYVNNLGVSQNDSGSFSGTVEFFTGGGNVTAYFSS